MFQTTNQCYGKIKVMFQTTNQLDSSTKLADLCSTLHPPGVPSDDSEWSHRKTKLSQLKGVTNGAVCRRYDISGLISYHLYEKIQQTMENPLETIGKWV